MVDLERNELRPGATSPTVGAKAILQPVKNNPFVPRALIPVEHDPWQHQVKAVDHDPFAVEKEGKKK